MTPDEEDARDYLASGRSAFWLFPGRWEGVANPHAECMRFDDGTWEPAGPPMIGEDMCRNCFSYRCKGCMPVPAEPRPPRQIVDLRGAARPLLCLLGWHKRRKPQGPGYILECDRCGDRGRVLQPRIKKPCDCERVGWRVCSDGGPCRSRR